MVNSHFSCSIAGGGSSCLKRLASNSMAEASGPAGPVLAGPVFGIAHAQNSNNIKTTIVHVTVNAYLPPAVQL